MDLTVIEQIGLPIIAAVIYALAAYFKNSGGPDGQTFEKTKFIATLVVGGVIGVIMVASGLPVTEESVALQMATYGGLVMLTEYIIKGIYRRTAAP